MAHFLPRSGSSTPHEVEFLLFSFPLPLQGPTFDPWGGPPSPAFPGLTFSRPEKLPLFYPSLGLPHIPRGPCSCCGCPLGRLATDKVNLPWVGGLSGGRGEFCLSPGFGGVLRGGEGGGGGPHTHARGDHGRRGFGRRARDEHLITGQATRDERLITGPVGTHLA